MRERRCIVRRHCLTEDRLIRFVASPDGVVTPDLAARLPGRGLWVSADRNAVREAAAKNLFSRAAKSSLTLPAQADGLDQAAAADALADQVGSLLKKQALGALGLTKRGGELVHGRMRVEERLNKGPVGALIEAADAAEDGRRQVRNKLFGLEKDADVAHAPVINNFTVAELSLALGAENVVHAAVNPGKLCRKLRNDTEKLVSYDADMAGTAPTPLANQADGNRDEIRK